MESIWLHCLKHATVEQSLAQAVIGFVIDYSVSDAAGFLGGFVGIGGFVGVGIGGFVGVGLIVGVGFSDGNV